MDRLVNQRRIQKQQNTWLKFVAIGGLAVAATAAIVAYRNYTSQSVELQKSRSGELRRSASVGRVSRSQSSKIERVPSSESVASSSSNEETAGTIPSSTNLLTRKLLVTDKQSMNELATFVEFSKLIKFEGIVDPHHPPEWYNEVQKVINLGTQVDSIPKNYRLPLLEAGLQHIQNALDILEQAEAKEKKLGTAFAHIAGGLFKVLFHDLISLDNSARSYLAAVVSISTFLATGKNPTQVALCVIYGSCNVLRKIRTQTEGIKPELVETLVVNAKEIMANRELQSKMDTHARASFKLAEASARLFTRQFQSAYKIANDLLAPLVTLVSADNAALAHQVINCHIICIRCLTEEKKFAEAVALLEKMFKWCSQSLVQSNPRLIVSILNNWRYDLSSQNNPLFWTTVTDFQLKIIQANADQFTPQEITQTMLLFCVHLCHAEKYAECMDFAVKTEDIIRNSTVATTVPSSLPQIAAVQGWALESLARRTSDSVVKQKRLLESWTKLKQAYELSRALPENNFRYYVDLKLAIVGESISDNPEVAEFVNARSIDIYKTASFRNLVTTLPGELFTPYWGLAVTV